MREQNLDVISRAAWLQDTTMLRKQQTLFYFCEFGKKVISAVSCTRVVLLNRSGPVKLVTQPFISFVIQIK